MLKIWLYKVVVHSLLLTIPSPTFTSNISKWYLPWFCLKFWFIYVSFLFQQNLCFTFISTKTVSGKKTFFQGVKIFLIDSFGQFFKNIKNSHNIKNLVNLTKFASQQTYFWFEIAILFTILLNFSSWKSI